VPCLGALPGGRWWLPVVAPLTMYAAFARRVREARYLEAWGLAVVWAALYSAGVIALTQLAPDVAARAILHGEPYRQEMFGWITTGSGPEVRPAEFVPQHLLHATAFALLSWASGGFLGLVLGAGLLGYMSYFVGSFAAAAGLPWLGSLAAWVPWSVLRVLAFVLAGTLLARPLLVRARWPFDRAELRLLGLALAGIVGDLILKLLLAPAYGHFLRSLLQIQPGP
jgi:hypothetical protein